MNIEGWVGREVMVARIMGAGLWLVVWSPQPLPQRMRMPILKQGERTRVTKIDNERVTLIDHKGEAWSVPTGRVVFRECPTWPLSPLL